MAKAKLRILDGYQQCSEDALMNIRFSMKQTIEARRDFIRTVDSLTCSLVFGRLSSLSTSRVNGPQATSEGVCEIPVVEDDAASAFQALRTELSYLLSEMALPFERIRAHTWLE